AALTDPGRKRRRNEDSFVADPPLFVVADGMGGAQAGEVASRLAAATFREFHEADKLGPEQRLEAIIQEANRRIFERARSDTQATGMGTTVTASLVGEERLSIGHVGDSRAYRIRGGALEQLTEDHSLVADLVRSGRLSPEEAEMHPQRSVITRALGTDPEVDVDTFTIEVETGDVFLLCSDGLTTMVEDDRILAVVRDAKSLEDAARSLVKEANRQGGEDNVTVVLFRLEAGEALDDSLVGGNGHDASTDLEDTLSGLESPVRRDAAPTETLVAPPEQARGWQEPEVPGPHPKGQRPQRRRVPRWLLWTLALLAILVMLGAAAFWGVSRAYFIGVEDDGQVAIYQGLPWDLSDGVHLYRAKYVSQLRAEQLTRAEREQLFDHDLASYERSRDRLAPFEEEGVP
ncbi:MAG TPA: Stp1/IreP family PP2C-type Ser/Thr phosphatase, partial [Gaiellaceae bacterium]|nr:Stp1/IreP family PP2C-type Ser/Thr phosphatase [Gaiellaceae bacterium]